MVDILLIGLLLRFYFMGLSLEEKVNNLPTNPGVYIYRDSKGSVLYVGKAKRLRNRVRSYFQDSRNHDGRIKVMVSKIADLETIITDSEAEALILESNLIKKYHPRYNIMYRDDKSYPYICVTKGKRPRVFPTRTIIRDGSRYYGPYGHVGQMRNMLETIRQTFNLCTCACSPKLINRTKGMPKWHSCFNEYIGECSGDWDEEYYQNVMERVIRLLNGKTDGLIRELKEEMEIAAQSLAFEKAAKLRDGIEALERYSNKMKIITDHQIDRDIFALEVHREEAIGCGVLFKIRDGKLIGKYHRFLKNIEELTESEILQTFVEDYYTSDLGGIIPDEVYLSDDLIDDEPLLEYLWQEHGKKVPIHVPKIGEKAQMMRMAKSNARLLIKEYLLQKSKAEKNRIPHSVQSLKRDLRLDRLPRRIECFDNSNIQGSDPVASMVCFVDGKPRKNDYKRFHIKTVVGPDDFASMHEIITRRYSRVMKEKQHIPDLIVVDGGKGQLSSAVNALKEIGFYGQVPIIGLAKRLEEVFIPGQSEAIMIPKTSSSLKLLQRVRDEAHRFAITFHREKRRKRTISSELHNIPGIGPKTAQKLLSTIGSVKKIKKADLEELRKVVGKSTGNKVFEYFHSNNAEKV
ncbi:MAG TPA: excinuclease ABC subunit UvrC [Balneolales bacterium]|nr:excinuclease ABC subunit UvrC [Balneolales bacterium]